jgi:HEAT repeat protein
MPDLDDIIADLHSDDVDRYVTACEELDRIADRGHLPRLYDLLLHGTYFTVREPAALPIARLEGVAALRALLHAKRLGTAENHDNDGLVNTILYVVEADPDGAAPILRQLLGSPEADDRADAAWLWGFVTSSLEAEPLFAAAADPSPGVRAAAVGSLESYEGRQDVYGALLNALADADASVRVAALSALGYWGDPRALPVIEALANDSDERVQQFLAFARDRLTRAK